MMHEVNVKDAIKINEHRNIDKWRPDTDVEYSHEKVIYTFIFFSSSKMFRLFSNDKIIFTIALIAIQKQQYL